MQHPIATKAVTVADHHSNLASGGAANRTARGGAGQSNTQNNHRGHGGRGGYHHTTSNDSESNLGKFDCVALGTDSGLFLRTLEKIALYAGDP